MEYLIGSLLTFVIMVVTVRITRRIAEYPPPPIRYSQSHIHNLIEPFIPTNSELMGYKKTQARKHLDNTFIRVVFLEGKAYFIKDNVFYVADVVDGDVDKTTAKQVDTMSMDTVQLNKIKFIVEKLTEGKIDDSGSAG